MLAKVVNDNAGNLTPRVALGLFASKLAPTVGGVGTSVGIYPASPWPKLFHRRLAHRHASLFARQQADQGRGDKGADNGHDHQHGEVLLG